VTSDKDFKRVVRTYARERGIPYAAARAHLRPGIAQRSKEHVMVEFNRAAPVLRIFDEDKAREFYVDYLGMTVDFEHRFDPDSPLYMQVSRGVLVLHLSEHHGDGTPGTHVSCVHDRRRQVAHRAHRQGRPRPATARPRTRRPRHLARGD
jgi:hypothetical protein